MSDKKPISIRNSRNGRPRAAPPPKVLDHTPQMAMPRRGVDETQAVRARIVERIIQTRAVSRFCVNAAVHRAIQECREHLGRAAVAGSEDVIRTRAIQILDSQDSDIRSMTSERVLSETEALEAMRQRVRQGARELEVDTGWPRDRCEALLRQHIGRIAQTMQGMMVDIDGTYEQAFAEVREHIQGLQEPEYMDVTDMNGMTIRRVRVR